MNLHVKYGEKVAIVGESGNGKSTIMKLLLGFYTPTQGTIYIDGIPIDCTSILAIRDVMGVVFQETYLFHSTVLENIKFGNPDSTNEQIIEAAKQANAHEFITHLSQGYETVIGERGQLLSGGQRQRIALARMLLKNPKIILLDEATAALDNESEQIINNSIKNISKDRTIIAIAHRLSSIQHYDRIIYLSKGKILEEGTYTELVNKKGPFYNLLSSSYREEDMNGVS
ncbi:hypothetical protein A3842_09120 [Paenibacillus sp. P3E]|nr:hypothetical protein A3842_09120 [Paenibacillus sp. P3E]